MVPVRSPRRFPLGATVTLATLDDDPYPTLAALREREPVTWAPKLDRWLVTSRSLALHVLGDTEVFTTASTASPILRTFGPQMLNTDGPERRPHRTPFAPAFRRRALHDELGDSVRARVNAAVDRDEHSGGIDLHPIAGDVAVGTVMDVLGLVGLDIREVRTLYDDLAAALANVTQDDDVEARGRAAAEAVRERLDRLMQTNASPRFTALRKSANALGLSSFALGSNVILVLFGGIETTQSMILNGAWALLDHADALADVRRDPTLVPAAVEESLRWEPAVQTLTRFVTRETELGAVELASGDIVECMIGGANRDPSHFTDPDVFDIHRPNAADHLTFGTGHHTCIGLHLARLEAAAVLERLLELPGLRLDPDRPTAPKGHEFRKPPSLHLLWG